MNKKITGIILCIILLMPALTLTSIAQKPTTKAEETEQITCSYYGPNGEIIPHTITLPTTQTTQLTSQLQTCSTAFVTLYSPDATEQEKQEAQVILDATLTRLETLGILPPGVTKEDAQQLLYPQQPQDKRALLTVIGSAGIGLLRPIHPAILPKLFVFWFYIPGITVMLGINGLQAKGGIHFGIAFFFIGLILSIGVAGAFFGFSPYVISP